MSEPPPLPPTPPSSLAPPPGYAAYQGPDFRQGGLKRLRGLATAIVAVLGVVAIGNLVSLLSAPSVRDAARDYLRDGDEDAFNDTLAVSGLVSAIAGLASIAIIVLSIIWLHRMTSNHQALGRTLMWTPGWAIAGWFLPPLLYIIPLLMLREAWKASNPQSPPGADGWKAASGESPLIWLWFLSYSVIPIIIGFIGSWQVIDGFDRDVDAIAERFVDDMAIQVTTAIVGLVAALAWGALVWSLTRRHTQLTGEANAR